MEARDLATVRRLCAVLGVAAACVGCGAASASGPAAASGHASSASPAALTSAMTTSASAAPAPLHATLGEFHFSSNDFKIDSDRPSEVVSTTVVIHPGTSKGWHTHPGPGFVIVTAGTLTLYQVGSDGRCAHSTYSAGQGFVEGPGIVHIARNEGSVDVNAVATYLDVPPGTTAYRTTVPAPAACPGIN